MPRYYSGDWTTSSPGLALEGGGTPECMVLRQTSWAPVAALSAVVQLGMSPHALATDEDLESCVASFLILVVAITGIGLMRAMAPRHGPR